MTDIDNTTRKRSPRMSYTQGMQESFERLIESNESLSTRLANVEITLAGLRGSMMSRPEIEAAMDKRVSVSSYLSDQRSLEKRVDQLEQAPQQGLAKWALWIAAIGTAANILISTHFFGH